MPMFSQIMTFKKETKGTVVYESDPDEERAIKTLYITKAGMLGARPSKIIVTVKEAQDNV